MQIIWSRALRLSWITLIAVSGCASQMPSLPTCSTANTCGDGIVQVGEPCDDGNAVDTDGCCSFAIERTLTRLDRDDVSPLGIRSAGRGW